MPQVRERLEAVLSRLAQRADDERVFTQRFPDCARAEADAADARARQGVCLGPLDGRLVSLKDLFDVAGQPTRAGSSMLWGACPAEADAVVVARLRRAGAVIVGKTNMTELAFSGIGINPHYGTPGNVVDGSRIPGGSSSGAAVSVCEGTSDIAVGTDTGGSVRIPASLNGCVGFKPTAARISRQGVCPLSYTLDSVGPLARTVADCAAADAVMAGNEPAPLQPAGVEGLRVGVPRGRLFSEVEPLVADGFEGSLSRLVAAGARAMPAGLEDLLEAMGETLRQAPIIAVEAAAVHEERLDACGAQVDPRVRARIEPGRRVPAAAYVRALRRRSALIDAMAAVLAPFDVIALPTTALTAPPTAPLVHDDDLFHRTNLLMLRNTAWCNLFDLTALSLPMPEMARPAGLMLVAPGHHDRRLLSVGAAVERLLQ